MSLSADESSNALPFDDGEPAPAVVSDRLGQEIRRLTTARLASGSLNIYREIISQVELITFDLVMKHCGGVQLRASDVLGISRVTLRTRIAAFNRQAESSP